MIGVALDEIDGLAVHSRPRGAFWVQWRLFSRYAGDVVLRGGSRRWPAKPVDEAERACPEWFRHLRFAFALLIRVVERAPGVGVVQTLRFENPPAGFVFLPEELTPIRGDLVEGAVRRAVGSCMENGHLVVNESWRTDFTCDCRAGVGFFLDLPQPAAWLDASVVEADARALAADYGVPVTTSVRL